VVIQDESGDTIGYTLTGGEEKVSFKLACEYDLFGNWTSCRQIAEDRKAAIREFRRTITYRWAGASAQVAAYRTASGSHRLKRTMNRRNFFLTGAAAVSGASAQAQSPARGGMRLGVITSIGKDPDAGVKRVKTLGFPTCQLSVATLDQPTAKALRAALDRYRIEATSIIAGGPGPEVYDFYEGPKTIGIIPRQYRAARIARIKQTSDFSKWAGIPAVQTHCGFIPENPNEPLYDEAVKTIREVAQYCHERGQSFRCETGQETPITLLRTLRDVNVPGIGVNLDAANLILYGKADPVEAVPVLGPYIQGIHAKDGLYPTDPKKLGKEVPIGSGKVNFPLFIRKLKEAGYRGPLTIEREIEGAEQTRDILASKAFLEKLI
jgi:L-ribulose-5-phosphate 3-epimerase